MNLENIIAQISHYELVKDRLIMQVMSADRNIELLKNLPHVIREDLALVCRIVVRDEEKFESCLVTKDMMANFGISSEQLFMDAMLSAPRQSPVMIKPLGNILEELIDNNDTGEDPADSDQTDHFRSSDMNGNNSDSELYFVGTQNTLLGSAAIFYPGIMEKCAEILGGDYYILPSSVHEMIIIGADKVDNAEMLNDMVHEINETVVAPIERLTDHVYFYDSEKAVFCSV